MSDENRIGQLLNEQDYMVIAVTLQDGSPWVVPVRILTHDGLASFEWDSHVETEHSKALAVHPVMAITIYQKKEQAQVGFCAKGKAELIGEIKPGLGRYKFTTQRAWINDETFTKRELTL